MKVLGVITARGGSKGVPGKNLRTVGGKPLIAWTIEAAQDSKGITRLILSSDDPGILEECRRRGVEAPFVRPATLADDDTPHVPVVLHALDFAAREGWDLPDYVLVLQPTSPLRGSQDIDDAIALAAARKAPAVVAVSKAHPHPSLSFPVAEDGTITVTQERAWTPDRRQDLPDLYAPNGAIFLVRPDVLRQTHSLYPPGTLAFEMPRERALDIDTEWDCRIADIMLGEIHQTGAASRSQAVS